MIGTYLFRIGSFGVPAMGVCVLVGAILAVLLSWILRKRTALDWNDAVVDAIISAVLLGFAGMKILYWIVTPNVFRDAFANGFFQGILSLLMEGMVFYGGLIGGILGIFLTARKKKKNILEFTDLMLETARAVHVPERFAHEVFDRAEVVFGFIADDQVHTISPCCSFILLYRANVTVR